MNFNIQIASFIAAFIPIAVFVFLIRWMDRYDREPWQQIIITFLLGACFSTLLSLVETSSIAILSKSLLTSEGQEFFITGLIAPLIEETNKGIFVILMAWLSKEFNNMTDGLVYGSVIGLGFAFSENIFYFYNIYNESGIFQWLEGVYARSFYTAGVHACSTAVFGGCIGYAKYTRFSHKILMLIIGFSLAVMIHSFWNSFLTVSQITNDPFLAKLPFAILPIICILLVVILQFCLMRESEILEIELTSESQNYQTLPIEHVAFIKSYINRSKNGWLSDNISKKQYCAKTTELAFLRQHYWRADEKNRHILELKMNKLRTEIQQLLSYSV